MSLNRMETELNVLKDYKLQDSVYKVETFRAIRARKFATIEICKDIESLDLTH